MNDLVDTWADVMRWWSPGGALLAIWPLSFWLRVQVRRYLDEGNRTVAVSLLTLIFAGSALVAFLLFALLAGTVIPFTSRLTGFGQDDHVFRSIMAAAWTLVALGAWMSAVALRRSRRLVAASSFFWLLAVVFGVSATAS
ncbi:hypothetical protein [Croceicoccus naphthovorans]|uniref:Uncharacterized protein n=1 Tax=Croceicoccus naphthovorans TaxID=1348774 RepID=A0A0G3XEA9_9SPHN|nr:hypothetical protein [Croceicoccus naphthovorans]AKM09885.1 hypothetical protein AB433_07640 [Croceicoccus naphthovorans]MBB3991348.1 hypothetical protein [Croceicoccus naphthovorans]